MDLAKLVGFGARWLNEDDVSRLHAVQLGESGVRDHHSCDDEG